jgi:hypothetical protein
LAIESKSMTYWCRVPQRRHQSRLLLFLFVLVTCNVGGLSSLLRDNVISNSRTSSRTIFSHFSFLLKFLSKKHAFTKHPVKSTTKSISNHPRSPLKKNYPRATKRCIAVVGRVALSHCVMGVIWSIMRREFVICWGLFGYRFTFYLIGSFVFLSFNLLIFVG